MADHLQQQILERVQAVLLAAATDAGSRVYLDRADEIPQVDVPAIDILGREEVGEESIDYLTLNHPAVQRRSYSFPITSYAKGNGAARASRNLAGAVESALAASAGAVAIGATAIEVVLAESSERKDGLGATLICAVRQVWQAQYQTHAGTPDVLV